MNPSEARFEFRVWGTGFDDVATRLREAAEYRKTRTTSETYLVASPAAVHANPKIRDDKLDVKSLVEVNQGFERWGVRLKTRFPVEAEVLSDDVLPLLGATPPALGRDRYSLDHLLDEVIGPHPDLTAVAVTKRREVYRLNGCPAEISDVTIAGRTLQTIAIESLDLEALEAARSLLGLDDHENVSYPRAIGEVLGSALAGA